MPAHSCQSWKASNKLPVTNQLLTYVVFMSMCDENSLDLVLPLVEECYIWQNLLHAQVSHAAGGKAGNNKTSIVHRHQ